MSTATPANTIDTEIARCLDFLASLTPNDPEYAKINEQLSALHALKIEESKGGVAAETWAMIGANLAGIGLILFHEQAHVIATKGFSLLWKLK